MSDEEPTTANHLTRHVGADGLVDFDGLEADLADLGREACVRVALHAADAVRARWGGDARLVQVVLDATRAWLAAPSDRARREAHRVSSRLRPLLRELEGRAYDRFDEEDFDDVLEDEEIFDEEIFDEHGAEVSLGCGSALVDVAAARSLHAGQVAFAAARAAHARTAATAAQHARGALLAACKVVDLSPALQREHGRARSADPALRLLADALAAATPPP